jgi:hypothetical protein
VSRRQAALAVRRDAGNRLQRPEWGAFQNGSLDVRLAAGKVEQEHRRGHDIAVAVGDQRSFDRLEQIRQADLALDLSGGHYAHTKHAERRRLTRSAHGPRPACRAQPSREIRLNRVDALDSDRQAEQPGVDAGVLQGFVVDVAV